MPPYSSFHCEEKTTMVTYPGTPHPLGAFYDGHGINFALYSEYATKVHLCLFRKTDDEPQQFLEYARINVKGQCRTLFHDH